MKCSKRDEKLAPRDNPKVLWNPGIYIGIIVAGNLQILLTIEINNARSVSDYKTMKIMVFPLPQKNL